MATRLARMVTNIERLLPIILLYPLVTWSCKITWQTKNISTTTVPMSTKVGRMVTNLKRPLPIMLLYPLVACSWEIIWQTISTNTMPMTIKLGRRVTHHEGFSPIKAHDSWIMWSSKIVRQTKAILSPLPWWLWLQKLAEVWLSMRSYP